MIKTLKSLAYIRVDQKVVNGQFNHLPTECVLENDIKIGTHNLSNRDKIKAWAEIVADMFEIVLNNENLAKLITTDKYEADKQICVLRLNFSILDISKFQKNGFESHDCKFLTKEYDIILKGVN